MIPCQDLRTGNIILVNKRLRRVTMIKNSDTLTNLSLVGVESSNEEENNNYPAEDIDAIPMTEAVLEQCNFTYHQLSESWQLLGTPELQTEMTIDPEFNLVDSSGLPIVKNIRSLHQLQNIYYMLFNKEMDFDVETTIVVDGTVRGVVKQNQVSDIKLPVT